MLDIFSVIRQRLHIAEVMTAYGVTVNHGKAPCPFHKEKTPSLKVYPDTGSFFCFGCGVGGDVIRFTEKLFGLEPLPAALKLNEDFQLGLSSRELSPNQKRELAAEITRHDEQHKHLNRFREWERGYLNELSDSIKALEKLRDTTSPSAKGGIFPDEFLLAVNRLCILEHHWDILFNGSDDEKLELYIYLQGGE